MVVAVLAVLVAGALALNAGAASPKAPPDITITFPASNAVNAAMWGAGCSPNPAGICGTASDPDGVANVTVAVRRNSDNKYWNGSAFSLTTQTFNLATGTTAWRYALPLPADGSYTAYVRAKDAAGNETKVNDATHATWRIDTVAPSQPTITSTPDSATFSANASFTYTNTETNGSSQCSMDNGPFNGCGKNGQNFNGLTIGVHCFRVRTLDEATNASLASTQFCWEILAKKDFSVDADVPTALYPGVTRRIDLQIGNPFNFPLVITSVTAHIVGTDKPGCSAAANFQISEQLDATPTIARNSTKSLSQLGIAQSDWPAIRMLNTSFNQDACQGAAIQLAYTGTSTK